MTVGIPLAILKEPGGEHEVVLNFSGVRWTMYVDGRLLDNDFPVGQPRWPAKAEWKLDPESVKTAAVYAPAIDPERREARTPEVSPHIQYWMPRGHNDWVGDVVTCFHDGRYHVFYLYDRRHHQSKFRVRRALLRAPLDDGLPTWTEHEAATPLEEQWECIGTGVPLSRRQILPQLRPAHDARVYLCEKTSLPLQWDYLKKHGRTRGFERAATPGFPAGSTYAASDDGGSHFRKSNVLFHPCENPSVYVDPGGKLKMMANYGSDGIWESDAIDGGWHCVRPGFPPGGDCTFFFRWGKFDYIIGGFKNLWSKPADWPDSAYEDVVRKGLDFYDGLAVPSITGVPGGRFLMAGWVPIRGWGGTLVLRELIQFPDGRIGSRWMEELTPRTERPVSLRCGSPRRIVPRGRRTIPAELRRRAFPGARGVGSPSRSCPNRASRRPASCKFARTKAEPNSAPGPEDLRRQGEVPARRRRAARDREADRRRSTIHGPRHREGRRQARRLADRRGGRGAADDDLLPPRPGREAAAVPCGWCGAQERSARAVRTLNAPASGLRTNLRSSSGTPATSRSNSSPRSFQPNSLSAGELDTLTRSTTWRRCQTC